MEHPGTNNRKPLKFLEFKEPGEGNILVKPREVLICEREFQHLTEAVTVTGHWQKHSKAGRRIGNGGKYSDHSLLLPSNLLLVLPISWNQSQSKTIRVMETTIVNFLGCKQGRKEWRIYDSMIKYRYSNFVLHITNKCVYVCVQSCTILCNCNPPSSSVLGIFQARILKWVAISYSRGSFQPRNQTHLSWVSCLGRRILYHHATQHAQTDMVIINNICLTS